jgi:hypothetical protein
VDAGVADALTGVVEDGIGGSEGDPEVSGRSVRGAVDEQMDMAIEASGSAAGLATCVNQVNRGGTVVLLGLLPPGNTGFPGNAVVTREITMIGAFRFDQEFDEALALLATGLPIGPIQIGADTSTSWRPDADATAGTLRSAPAGRADHRVELLVDTVVRVGAQ